MCTTHGAHVVFLAKHGAPRCALCGRRIDSKSAHDLLGWVGEIINRFRARSRGSHWPYAFDNGTFYY